MQASTSKIVCNAVSTCKPAVRTSVRCASRTRRPGTSTSTTSKASSRARKAAAAAAPAPNAMSFSEAIRTLQSLSVGKDYAAYELTLLSRLAASVNINSLRGRTFLPHEAGKPTKKELVLVFAEGEQAEEARRNGADVVGGSELIDEILQSRVSPTKIICAPDQLSTLTRSQLPRILGPKGLMPSAKRGTVTADIGKAIKDARGGLDWLGVSIGSPQKTDKNAPDRAMVSVPIARISFDEAKIQENVRQFGREVLDVCNGVGTQAEVAGDAVQKKKKAAIEKMFLKTTMSMSIEVTDAEALIGAA